MMGLHNLFNTLTGRDNHKKKDAEGNTALYKAVKDGSIHKVRELLKAGADPNTLNEHHLTPLHQAAYWGELEIVDLLLAHGARVDLDNGKGWTALHSAAVSGGMTTRKDIIDKLLAKGADPDKQDKHGWTPKDYMVLWQANAEAAEKLKKYIDYLEGLTPPNTPPEKKLSGIRTPKH